MKQDGEKAHDLGKPLGLLLFHYIWEIWTKILLEFHFLQLVVVFMHCQIIIQFMKTEGLFWLKSVSNEAILNIVFVNLEEQFVSKEIFELPRNGTVLIKCYNMWMNPLSKLDLK